MSNESVPMHPLTSAYAEILAEEGFRPTVDGRTVFFKTNGYRASLENFDGDATYVRIAMYFDAPGDEVRCLKAANANNVNLKAIKTSYFAGDPGVLFSFETFYETPEHFKSNLTRVLGVLHAAHDRFSARLDEPDDAPQGVAAQ